MFSDPAYGRLTTISVGHRYGIRASAGYRRQHGHYEPIRSCSVAIGERRGPQPSAVSPANSVHQGDFDCIKGLYLINLVDTVTQFEVVVEIERIREHFLIPTLRQAMATFPFALRGFHSDNGSEYINYQLAEMLDTLRIEFTKYVSGAPNDNALVESKNASVVRKHLGYSHNPSRHAQVFSSFLIDDLIPYLNNHRPRFFPEVILYDKGRQRRRYPLNQMNEPYEQLKALSDAKRFLKPELTFDDPDRHGPYPLEWSIPLTRYQSQVETLVAAVVV